MDGAVNGFSEKVSFIWSIAELLRGPYKPAQYGDVILPLTVLRRLDCVLEPTKAAVLKKHEELKVRKAAGIEAILNRVARQEFHNVSRLDFQKLKAEPDKIAQNLTAYIKGFSTKAREIIEYFGFEKQIEKLDQHNRLFLIVSKFAEIDLHPGVVPNTQMGYAFEELIRKFNELSNEEAGDHFTPREVIRLIVEILFTPDSAALTQKGIIRTLYDCACGTGGMLSVSDEHVHELNPDAKLILFGQEYNEAAYAVCGSDMLIKGQSLDNIKFGDTFTADGLKGERFDYMLANPPFGVEWKPQQDAIRRENESEGYGGRFGAGLPRISDGSFLFLQHMISKMKPREEGGSRIGIVFNGSPLFTGDAGSGESEIRRWIIENDWLEAIIALPDQLFYNTGISTYVWIVTNRKSPKRRKKVQLINAASFFQKMRKSLGQKRNEISRAQIEEIARIYGAFADGPHAKVFANDDFGYRQITVERPLRLRFEVTAERIAVLVGDESFEKAFGLSRYKPKDVAESREAVTTALQTLVPSKTFQDRDAFLGAVKDVLSKAGVKIGGPLRKLLTTTFSERDSTAEVCLDDDGNPEPDSELRDTENVPLKEDVRTYFKREVLPDVPGAWIDDSKMKIGYEIPFNRYFYTYAPPRPLEDIEAEIQGLESDIVRMLRD
ncbi:MAG: class I SAM-dependent DNA methyltransferase, partial [Thermoanaerobaculia bacterium]